MKTSSPNTHRHVPNPTVAPRLFPLCSRTPASTILESSEILVPVPPTMVVVVQGERRGRGPIAVRFGNSLENIEKIIVFQNKYSFLFVIVYTPRGPIPSSCRFDGKSRRSDFCLWIGIFCLGVVPLGASAMASPTRWPGVPKLAQIRIRDRNRNAGTSLLNKNC